MSLSDHRYVARIAPVSSTTADAVHGGATIVDESGQRVTESFASGGLTWPTKFCPVLIDHEERFPVGFVSDFAEREGWNEATFVLDMAKPLADVACELLRVGTPVSLGAKSLRRDESLADLGLAIPVRRHTIAFLEEVSILSPGVRPAFKGAKVIRITERGTALDRMRERERVEAKPKPTQPVGEVVIHHPEPAIVYRTQTKNRHAVETAELRRRQEWLEEHGYRVSLEEVLENLKSEVGYGRDLSREWRRTAA